jgi:hypothetical protein
LTARGADRKAEEKSMTAMKIASHVLLIDGKW